MSTSAHDDNENTLPPTPMRRGGRGGSLRTGNPGNRGGRGRPHRRIIIRAGQNLERELARLDAIAKGAHDVTCPGCEHTFTPPPTATMPTRDRIGYARLLFEVKESGKGDDEPPLQIMVLSASASEIIAHVGQPTPGVVYVDSADLPAADPPARDSALGPPGVTKSGFRGE